MAENLTPNLDLEQILATLAGLQQLDQSSLQQQPYQLPQQNAYHQPVPHHITQDPRLQRPSVPQQAPPRPQAALIDPSTITEWKQGLRCVSKIAAQNPEFAAVVRKLMKDQESNVAQWEAGRQRLIEDQRLKKENEQTHRAALSLPGLLDNTPIIRTSALDASELTLYDAKVYRASKAMVESQTSSLKVLGVPFFGVRPYLMLHESEEIGLVDPSRVGSVGSIGSDGNRKIRPEELLELQRKMLGYLVELYGA